MSHEGLPPEVMLELQRNYLAGFDQYFVTLDQCLEEKNWGSFKEVCHKLVGSGQTYDFSKVTTIARALEAHIEKAHPIQETELTAGVKLLKKIIDDYKLALHF